MNFLHILRRYVFIFLAFACGLSFISHLSASDFQEIGRPHIQTCLPGTYTYVNHYNSIVQSGDGFIFIGARNGILSYNGTSWKHITVTGEIHLVSHRDRVIAWSKNQLGHLNHSSTGLLEFVPGTPWQSGEILQVISSQDSLYVLSTEGLFSFRDGALTKIEVDREIRHIFPSGDGIFLLDGEKELYHFPEELTQPAALPGGIEQLSDILVYRDKTFYIDGINHKMLYTDSMDDLHKFSIPELYLKEYGFSCAALLPGGDLVLGTLHGGIILADSNGEVMGRIGMEGGLYSNGILDLMVDATGNLWALHEDAISRIEIPSAFSVFNPGNGLEGNVKDILRYKGILYVASSRGLFRLLPQKDPVLPNSPGAGFTRIMGPESDFCCLDSTPSGLIAGGNDGLFHLDGKRVNKILSDPVNDVYYCYQQNILLVGTDRGFRMFNPDGWEEILDFALPDISFDDIAVSPSGFLWLSSRSGTLYRSSKPADNAGNMSYSSYTAKDLQSAPGSYIELLPLKDRLFFSAPGGLFTFNSASEVFEPDSLFLESRIKTPDLETSLNGVFRISQLEKTTNGNVWILLNRPDRKVEIIWQGRSSVKGIFDMEPVTHRRLNSKNINSLYPEEGNILWIGTHQGLFRYDPAYLRADSTKAFTYISGFKVAGKSRSDLIGQDHLSRIARSSNNLRFEFISTDFNCETLPLFQYRLRGLSDDWSDWNRNAFTELGGLKSGRYTFEVRSQDIFGSISKTDSFGFRIKTPLFASWYALLFYAILALLIVYYIQRWITLRQIRDQYHLEEVVQERTESLIKEKEKSEDLLANILPKTTSDELKLTGKATSSKYKMCTVLFSDIQGFTKIAEEMDADKLIDQLDRFYFQFDSVVEKYNIEKIKTIGDAYMAAGGIPIKNRTNPVEVVLAALEMQKYMKELKNTKSDIWDLRIGIHTGSVIAGVVGHKKYSYDIWGDTVNTASRMESSGEPGRVNISATTYKLIKDFFQCEFRGKMPVKYKGDIAMFFVNGLNPTYTEADRITPNSKFWVQVQLLRLLDVEEFVIEKLEKELPEDLFFHNVEHTSHVYSQVELLGRGEKVSDEDLLLVRTAALLHDLGYIDRMDDHESRSVEYAREILPLYRYNEDQIERICNLIMATSIPPDPKNLLEQIICDANLDHVGRVDFLIQSDKLFQEYRMRHKIKSKRDWNNFQISFLESHEFYTEVARKMREVPRDQQIENIKQFS